ncbi:Ribonuclease [compost metagenome]
MEWTPQQVIDSVNEAFAKKEVFKNNRYRGNADVGMKIEMVIRNGKIISAYPLY